MCRDVNISLEAHKYEPLARQPSKVRRAVYVLCCCICAFMFCVPSRAVGADTPHFATVKIPRFEGRPVLEDFLDMKPSPAWEGKLAKIDQFLQRAPNDGAPVSEKTVTYLGYNKTALYAIFVCFDSAPKLIRARLGRREDIFDDDWISLMLDTFHDERRAYTFFTNPLGVQADAVWTEQQQDFDYSFDTVWNSEGKLTPEGYVVWIEIPFRSLRFASNDPQTWGVMLNRGIVRKNERVFWPQWSSHIAGRLNQEGIATGLEGISPGRNLQFIPHVNFSSFRTLNTRDPNTPGYSHRMAFGEAGLDSKVVFKDKFVLDTTVNPDFSQVESDEPQVTVGQRFEVLFPEKRPFFLENSNYFMTPLPFGGFHMFLTRHIVNPQYGIRLTGKDGPWSVGLLAADDRWPGQQVPETDVNAGKRAYFGIARIARDIGSQSTLGVMYTDREFAGSFNRLGGIDGRFRLNTHWIADFQGLVSSTRTLEGRYLAGPLGLVDVYRQGYNFNYEFHFNDRGIGFRTVPGVDNQPDVRQFDHAVSYTFHPKDSFLLSWGPSAEIYESWDHEGDKTWAGYVASIAAELPRQTTFNLSASTNGEMLRTIDYPVLPTNHMFNPKTLMISANTQVVRQAVIYFTYSRGTRINYTPPAGMEPFLASWSRINTTLTVRPSRSLRIDNTYLLFRLTDRFSPRAIINNHIVRSKWSYQMTRRASFRVIGQYTGVLTNSALSAVPSSKNFNADFLFTYLVHPNTALYVGYNSNLENLDPSLGIDSNGNLLRGTRFINDGRRFFVKLSYLFRF